MAGAATRRLAREIVDPNGSPAVQQQADFLTRNMGVERFWMAASKSCLGAVPDNSFKIRLHC